MNENQVDTPADQLMREIVARAAEHPLTDPHMQAAADHLAADHLAADQLARVKALAARLAADPGQMDTARAAAEFAYIVDPPPPCPDCRGTGEAAGGFPGEDCKTCRGTSEAQSEGSSA